MNEINRWISDGSSPEQGLELLSRYCPNENLKKLVRLNPRKFAGRLTEVLSQFADSGLNVSGKKFRKQWAFLSDPNCPQELKILASDKITAYHAYVDAHAQLTACTDIENLYKTAKKIVENYKQNRKILSEFEYYREHGKVLGKHEIFEQTRRLEEIRKMSAAELAQRLSNLRKNIWRIKAELKKGDKPHLEAERIATLTCCESELEQVKRLIEGK